MDHNSLEPAVWLLTRRGKLSLKVGPELEVGKNDGLSFEEWFALANMSTAAGTHPSCRTPLEMALIA